MTNDEIIATLVQRVATLSARCDALQSVLLSTIAALGQASAPGAEKIEKMSLFSCEMLCQAQAKRGAPEDLTDQTRKFVETILASARAARTGRAQ